MTKKTTHFGFREIPEEEKSALVADVFHSVASKYDLMNDLMSLGLHRYWKSQTIVHAQAKKGQKILDVASGTGDLAKAFAKLVGNTGQVILSDINESMLVLGRDKLTDHGIVGNVAFVQADAEQLPFAENSFDTITIAFGLRNVTDKAAALASMFKALKPGGQLLILEFSHPTNKAFDKFYELYSFHIIPHLGKLITGDKDSYTYLIESIRMHPNQETLKNMLETAGFEDVTYKNFTSGIVALHRGHKY